jgi:hypothetical protein
VVAGAISIGRAGLTEEEPVMSTISFVPIAIISVFASIVYEFTVISRFIAEQKLKLQDERVRNSH